MVLGEWVMRGEGEGSGCGDGWRGVGRMGMG